MSKHLEELLDQKNERIDDLEEKVRKLEQSLRGASTGWSLPRDVPDDGIGPVPRLEFEWTDRSTSGTWNDYEVEYRLVMVHLLGHVVRVPLGLTRSAGSSGVNRPAPYKSGDLPFRDGAHAHHDSAHLDIPCFMVTPDGLVPVSHEHGSSQRKAGREHRRADRVRQAG